MLALTLAAALLAPAIPAQDAASAIARVERGIPADTGLAGLTIEALLKRFNVPGISIAVVRDFTVLWSKGYGVADAESGKPVDVNTAFQAASISKPIAAMAAVKLSQDGKLNLDGDVNAVLRSWKVPASELTQAQPVTPRSLMSHTSGSDDGFGFPGYDPAGPMPTPVQVINGEKPSNVGVVKFGRPPYVAAKYSGGAVTIMQVALADIAKKPFAEFMQSTILGPLGMTGSSYQQPPNPAWEPRLARAHGGDGKRRAAPWHTYPEQAAAGLWTTPTDLAKAMIEVQTAIRGQKGAVLTQHGAREMLTPIGAGPFAVGFQIAQRGEGWYFMHGGANWGFRCNLVGHFRKGYGVVVMTNGDNGGLVMREIESRVAAAYAWDMLDKPLPR
ncbi:MAG: beta-lactamase family protein [Cytophagaceae bacterium]|nr:beta-lactamase family protein [Gemmatimonadaceae bacterium]